MIGYVIFSYNKLRRSLPAHNSRHTRLRRAGKSTAEKVAITRKYREEQYEKLLDAVYKRRGWTPNGVPTLERLKSIGMDLPEVVEVVKPLQ